jgi:hypothetical protein
MKKTYRGSCHCGAVRFEADIDLAQGTIKCNCTHSFKTRAWLAGIPASDFRLVSGAESLADYQFGRRRIHHRFCKTCGVRPFSEARDMNGNDLRAVRVNCLDGIDLEELIAAPVQYVDMLHDDFKSRPAEIRHL